VLVGSIIAMVEGSVGLKFRRKKECRVRRKNARKVAGSKEGGVYQLEACMKQRETLKEKEGLEKTLLTPDGLGNGAD